MQDWPGAQETVQEILKGRKKSSCMSRKYNRRKKIDRAVDDEVYSELLPADKVEKVEELIQIKSEKENMICVFQYNSEASCC